MNASDQCRRLWTRPVSAMLERLPNGGMKPPPEPPLNDYGQREKNPSARPDDSRQTAPAPDAPPDASADERQGNAKAAESIGNGDGQPVRQEQGCGVDHGEYKSKSFHAARFDHHDHEHLRSAAAQ